MISPSRTIEIAEKEYILDGSFATLRAVQETFKMDVLQILFSIPEMRLDQVALLVALASGQRDKTEEIGTAILDSVGAITPEYGLLKTELVAWLNVALAPKADREKKRADMEELFQKASPGKTTSASV